MPQGGEWNTVILNLDVVCGINEVWTWDDPGSSPSFSSTIAAQLELENVWKYPYLPGSSVAKSSIFTGVFQIGIPMGMKELGTLQ